MGIVEAPSIVVIAMTSNNSIRVKPLVIFNILGIFLWYQIYRDSEIAGTRQKVVLSAIINSNYEFKKCTDHYSWQCCY